MGKTDELAGLSADVSEAVAAIDNGNGVFVDSDDCLGGEKWKTVRAELLRLQSENSELRDEVSARVAGWYEMRGAYAGSRGTTIRAAGRPLTRLRIIDGSKPAPKPRTVIVCTCQTRSRTFVQAVTGLVRDDKGKIINGPGAVKQWVCAYCGKPVA